MDLRKQFEEETKKRQGSALISSQLYFIAYSQWLEKKLQEEIHQSKDMGTVGYLMGGADVKELREKLKIAVETLKRVLNEMYPQRHVECDIKDALKKITGEVVE